MGGNFQENATSIGEAVFSYLASHGDASYFGFPVRLEVKGNTKPIFEGPCCEAKPHVLFLAFDNRLPFIRIVLGMPLHMVGE